MDIYLPRALSVVWSSLQLVFAAQSGSGKQSTSSPSVPGTKRATKLSFLTMSTCVASGQNIPDFQRCFNVMREKYRNDLLKSDAMLYAPSIDDIQRNCEYKSLKCFTEELMMVLNEEQIKKNFTDCIFEFNENLTPSLGRCPECETYPLKNITIFLERLDTLLKKLVTESNV